MELNLIFLATIFLFITPWRQVSAEFPTFTQPVDGDGALRFLVVGDWGRKGEYNQTLVASQMGTTGEELEIDFVISTGDNFYENGLTGTDDASFGQSFTNIYTASSLQKPWFVVLGNHDYRGDALAQLSPVLSAMDTRWHCSRSFIVEAGVAEFFFVDTTPFVQKYVTDPKDDEYDWRGITPLDEYTANILTDLDSALKTSKAIWRIVVGHHTLRSVGEHGDTQELVDLLLPILRANGVDFYVNGHDHNLQRIADRKSEIEFLTSGGGSEAWRGDIKEVDEEVEDLKFLYDGQGFMAVRMTAVAADFTFYDVNRAALHQWTKQKSQASS